MLAHNFQTLYTVRLGCLSARHRKQPGEGVSGGGNVLLHLATRHPERVTALVLVSATTHFPEQARPIMRSYTIELLPEEEREKMRRNW